MELAAALRTATSGGLILAAIAHVFTIGYVANQLGEDEDWLFELSGDMFPEDAASGSMASARMAFPPSPETASTTCARSSPKNAPLAAPQRGPKRPNSLACGGHRMETLNTVPHSLTARLLVISMLPRS